MKAGPRKGSAARIPRCWPLSERSAALRTRSSSGVAFSPPSTCRSAVPTAALTALTATLTNPFDEHRACQAEWDAHAAALDTNADRALELAYLQHLEAGPGQQGSPLQLAKANRVVVGYALDHQLLASARFAQRPVAHRADLARQRGDGVTVGVQLRAAEQLEDPLLHPLGDHVFQPFGFVVDLVPAVAEDLDEEHLQQAVVPNELEGDFAALASELLSAVAVVHDEALSGEARDHFADAGRRDAETLSQVAGRNRALIAVQLVEGFEVILLASGKGAAPLELLDHDLGFPNFDRGL